MVDFIPVFTTILALIFFLQIWSHYSAKREATYLLWWTIGVFTYGLGTITESIHAFFGWTEINTKVWYISGALLGGFPLAQGTAFLMLKPKWAKFFGWFFSIVIVVTAALVLLSPMNIPDEFDYRLTGKVLSWKWIRWISPFINTYSFLMLVGGAVYSARQYYRLGPGHSRFLGNVFIAVGALLPGVGGSFTRMGHVEVLFVTELAGLVLIYSGYSMMRTDRTISIFPNQKAFQKNELDELDDL